MISGLLLHFEAIDAICTMLFCFSGACLRFFLIIAVCSISDLVVFFFKNQSDFRLVSFLVTTVSERMKSSLMEGVDKK